MASFGGGSVDFRELLKIRPVTLRFGRTVCGAHRLETCPLCCLDFSHMNAEIADDRDSDDDEDESDDLDEQTDDMEEPMDDATD